MIYDVPFVSNTKDDLHCLQAANLMILKYYLPDYAISWEEWSKVTGFESDKGTWEIASLLWFQNNSFEVKRICLFDYQKFIDDPEGYLIKLSGQEIGNWQIAHSNIPLEQKRSIELLNKIKIEEREPTQNDIKQLLKKGYLVHCLLNARTLNGKSGYFGHAVVVSGFTNNAFIIQDPGLPPIPNRKVSFELFEKSWADPNIESKELDAIKLK